MLQAKYFAYSNYYILPLCESVHELCDSVCLTIAVLNFSFMCIQTQLETDTNMCILVKLYMDDRSQKSGKCAESF